MSMFPHMFQFLEGNLPPGVREEALFDFAAEVFHALPVGRLFEVDDEVGIVDDTEIGPVAFLRLMVVSDDPADLIDIFHSETQA